MADWLNMFDAALQLATPVTDEQLHKVPSGRGVVALMAGDRPIVLLPAANMRARALARLKAPASDTSGQVILSKMPDLRDITTSIHWVRTWSNFETDLAYFELASAIWPQEQLYAKLLAWKPPWFIQVDPAEQFPRFVRTREVECGSGTGAPPMAWGVADVPSARRAGVSPASPCVSTRYLGPFPSGSAADKFIQIIADVFDLCRDYKMLRQAPGGRPCAWAQIGKCLGPCHGKVTLDQYRQVIAKAADFAAGRRDELKAQLHARMKDAASRLAFEEASAVKHRLTRIEELSAQDYRFVRDVGEFQYILIQTGPTRRKARVFVADLAEITQVSDLDYPPKSGQLEQLLSGRAKISVVSFPGSTAFPGCAAQAGKPVLPNANPSVIFARPLTRPVAGLSPDDNRVADASPASSMDVPPANSDATRHALDPAIGKWRMGLVAHYLFCSPQRSGVAIHCCPSLTMDEVAHRLEDGHELLHLSKPKPKA